MVGTSFDFKGDTGGKSGFAQIWRDENGDILPGCASDEYIPSSPTFLVKIKAKSSPRPEFSERTIIAFLDYKKKLLNDVAIFAERYSSDKHFYLSKGRVYQTLAIRASENSRYFAGGRRRMQKNIRVRMGVRWFSAGVLMTLTYDPKGIEKAAAWRDCGKHLATLLHTLNSRRYRVDKRGTKYIWVIEEQEGTGYPHIHCFFPGLRYLTPVEDMPVLWPYGRHEVKYKDRINVASYCCKYLAKLDAWSVESQAMIWHNRKRVYGYSKCYVAPQNRDDKRVSAWSWVGTVAYGQLLGNAEMMGDGKMRVSGDGWLGPGVVTKLSRAADGGVFVCQN